MNKYIEYFKIAATSIKRRKIRSFLNFLSIMIGIAAVLTLILVGEGFKSSVEESFEQMGLDKIYVIPGGGIFGMGAGSLSEHDLNVIKRMNAVDEASGLSYKLGRVKYGDEQIYTLIIGMDTETSESILKEAQNIKIENGRDLKKSDKYKCLIGYLIANGEIFEKEISVGKEIIIEGKPFRIVGSLSRTGNPQDDSQIYLPLNTFNEIFGTHNEYNMIIVKVKKQYNPSNVAEVMKEKLRKARGLREGEEDFEIQTSEQLIRSFSQIFGVIFIALTGVAAISLLVGGVGMMNTMYTAVSERTKEIGIMKAVGARNVDVLMIFVIESGLLGLIGGIGGTVLGIAATKAISFIADAIGYGFLKTPIDPLAIVLVLIFSFIVGIVSGYLPAKEAAKLKPVDSLRYE